MTVVDFGRLEVEKARYESLLDHATGLPKWTLLLDRVAVALARSRRSGLLVAVFVLDDPQPTGANPLDRVSIAAELRAHLRPDDTLAVIGERRFAIVCGDIRQDEDAAMVARRMIRSAGMVSGLGVALGGSDRTPESLIKEAIEQALVTTPAT